MATLPQFARIFKGGSVNRRIFRAAASVGAAGILVKIVATFKEVAVAGVYGRSDAMDAFLAAALIPSLLINLISESMNQALVPTLIRVREQEGHERAQQLLSSSMLWMCLLLAAASALMALSRARIFPPDSLALSLRQARALDPPLLRAFCPSYLSPESRPTAPPSSTPSTVLPFPRWLRSPFPSPSFSARYCSAHRFGIWAMVYSTLAGSLVHAAWSPG